MRKLSGAVTLAAGLLAACQTPAPPSKEIPIYPVVAGSQTPLYTVETARSLRLAPGVRTEPANGPNGPGSAFVILRQNGATGGYMACGCVGAQTSSCRTTSDNPEHPACEGSCTDSEGNSHPCDLFGMIGPPKDPLMLRFRAPASTVPGTGAGKQ